MQSQSSKGYACVLLSVLIWSGWIVVSRYGVKGPLSPYDITAIRFTVSGLILLPIAWRRGFRIGPYGAWGGFLMAFFIGAPYNALAVLGMRYAPASHASTIINGTLLVTTSLVGILFLKEHTNRLRLTGIGCSLLGMGCMLFAKPHLSGGSEWTGHLLFFISGLMWSTYTLMVRIWKADVLQAAAAVCVCSMIFYMPSYLILADCHITLRYWHEVAFQCVYQGILTAVVALISYNTGIRILGASRAGAFVPLVPVLSTLLAMPVLGETPSLLEATGVSAVSFGVLLASGIFHHLPFRLMPAQKGPSSIPQGSTGATAH